jgi:hypothetical protein
MPSERAARIARTALDLAEESVAGTGAVLAGIAEGDQTALVEAAEILREGGRFDGPCSAPLSTSRSPS